MKQLTDTALQIAEKSQKMAERWLLYGVRKGWTQCGCVKCLEMLKLAEGAGYTT